MSSFTLRPVWWIRSELRSLEAAPKQGVEGAPDAWLELEPAFARALLGIAPGDDDGTPVVDVRPVLPQDV